MFAAGMWAQQGRLPAASPEIVRVEVTATAVTAGQRTPSPSATPDPTTPTPLPTPAYTPPPVIAPTIIYRDRWRICHVVGVIATVVSPQTERRVAAEAGTLLCPFTITAEQIEALE